VSYPWGGGSLYDGVVLACNEELLKLPRERNALVIVGDMADYSARFPQAVSFAKLRGVAEEMPILLYPVEMPFYTWTDRHADTTRANLQALAEASGGRMFRVNTLAGLKSTAAQVADELRSVYTIAYYPKNQAFDGKWREIAVHVERPGVTLRTRRGYYAR
jgi:Ca-activated chloride channel family protein